MRERIGLMALCGLVGFLFGSLWGWETAVFAGVLFAVIVPMFAGMDSAEGKRWRR